MALGNMFSRNRRAAPVAADTTTSTGGTTTSHNMSTTTGNHHEKHAHNGRGNMFSGRHHGAYPESLNSRPTFGQWFKGFWVDLLTMIAMGAIGLGVYEADPAPSRSFPVTYQDGQIVYPQFAYPLRKEIIPIWAAALMAVLIPIAVFLIVSVRVRSFWDLNNATVGLLYSVISAAVFQVFCKWLIGGLRPHFLSVCKPNVPIGADNVGDGFLNIMYHPDVCTGDRKEINDSLESFPSGHTTAAFGGFVYLSLYLNAKLKVFSNYHPAMWKLIATYAPILGAVLIGGSLTIDEYHNWYDVVAGGLIGTMFAFSAYRMMYASIFDFRFNHIPLARDVPFTYSHSGSNMFHGFHDAIWTRKAGWGGADTFAAGGAPFDASALGGGGSFGGMGSSSGMGAAGYRGSAGGILDQGHHEHGTHGTTSQQSNRYSSVGRKPVPAVGHTHGDQIV